MMRQQRGIALSDLLLWGLVIILAAVFGLKLLPGYIEYFEIRSILKDLGKQAATDGLGNNDIRERFDKYTSINNVNAVSGTDLDINRESGRPVITVEYTYKTQLVGNLSALLDFSVSSNVAGDDAADSQAGAAAN